MTAGASLFHPLFLCYHYFWPDFNPQNHDKRPSIDVAALTGTGYSSQAATTGPLSETVVIVILLIISQLMIPATARFIVRLWPGLREHSTRVVLMLGWYAVMASWVIGARYQLEEAWRMGFERGVIEGSVVERS